MVAAHKGKTDCVKALVAAGADVNAKSNGGRAALAWAAELKSADSVKVLIAAGANVNAKDNDGETALMTGCAFINGVPLNSEIVTTLLDHGADPNLEDSEGETALSRVFHFDHLDWASQFTDLLVMRGARQVPGKSGDCPECGSPKSTRMEERGIEVTFHTHEAGSFTSSSGPYRRQATRMATRRSSWRSGSAIIVALQSLMRSSTLFAPGNGPSNDQGYDSCTAHSPCPSAGDKSFH